MEVEVKRLVWVILCCLMIFTVSCKSDNTEKDEVQNAIGEAEKNELNNVIDEEDNENEVEKDIEVKVDLNKEQLDKNDDLFSSFVKQNKTSLWSFDGQASGWSMAIPDIVPFKSEDDYRNVSLEIANYERFEYVNPSQTLESIVVHGDVWELVHEDDSISEEQYLQAGYDFRQYVLEEGGDYLGQYDNHWVFHIERNGHYYIDVDTSYYQTIYTIVKENTYIVNEELKIEPNDLEYNEVFYDVVIPEDKFITLIATVDQNDVSIDFDMENYYGQYRRRTSISDRVSADEGGLLINDNYIYEPGRGVLRISWSSNDMPGLITLKLEAKYDVEPIEYGQALGGITLSSHLVNTVSIVPTLDGDVDIDHPEFDEIYFDKNQENGFVTFVPAGYYTLDIGVSEGIVNNFKTIRVPVQAGKMTYVDVPKNTTDAIKSQASYMDKGIEITEVKEAGDQVSFIFTLLDDTTKEILPAVSNSEIYEGGMACEITEIQPIPTPAKIILLLDSSGSMKGQMEDTIEAAKKFIEGLPEDALIQVLDFDSEVKPLKAESRSDLLVELESVKAKGATVLYDGVIEGLDLLSDYPRPILLVFTDGEDANLNDTARGSVNDLNQAISAIEASDVPIFTIGFGNNHDASTLSQFSDLSLGKYYSAENQEALSLVFEAINQQVTSTYMATYKRPEIASVSDIPVIHFVVDTSGSMSGEPLKKVKAVIHNFVDQLPNESQIIITGFNDAISLEQGVTVDRVLALNAIGSMEAGGGTDIFNSVRFSQESLSRVNSSKKILVYITDEAMDVGSSDQDAFDKILDNLKEEDVQALWVGIGVSDAEPFEYAAKRTQGEYMVTEDPNELVSKFESLLEAVRQAPLTGDTLITYNIKKKNENGAFEAFSKSILYALSELKHSDEILLQDTIQYEVRGDVKPYNKTTSALLTGENVMSQESLVTKKMPVDFSASNEAMKVQVNEIVFMSKFNGLDAPRNYRFMAVQMSLTNVLPEQEVIIYPDGNGHPSSWVTSSDQGEIVQAKIPYVIPNFINHFGLGINQEGPFPADAATWLSFEPLVVPGQYDITLEPDATKEGMMVFVVPDQALKQMSLHYFDDNYGHIHLPIVDEMVVFQDDDLLEISDEVKINDTFNMALTGIGQLQDTSDDDVYTYDILEANFESDLKANLNIDPTKLLLLKIKTENGDFFIDLAEKTNNIPYGFYHSQTLMPGSRNPIKMLFQVPEALSNYTKELMIDMAEDKVMTVQSKQLFKGNSLTSFETPYFKGDVQGLYQYSGNINGYNADWLIADVTIHDYKDGYATRGIANNFYLTSIGQEMLVDYKDTDHGFDEELSKLTRPEDALDYDSRTDELLLGFKEDTIVYDGTSRRGFIAFRVKSFNGYELRFDATDLQFSNSNTINQEIVDLLVTKAPYFEENGYEADFNVLLTQAIEAYQRRHPDIETTPNGDEKAYESVITPYIGGYGNDLIKQIESESDLIQTLRSIRFLTDGSENTFKVQYSKEAMLTQGFGTEGDMANMAIEVLSRLGYVVELKEMKLTQEGQDLMKVFSGYEDMSIQRLPAVIYQLEDGSYKTLVLPFARYLEDLDGLVYYDGGESRSMDYNNEVIYVYFDLEPTENGQLAMMNNMAGALGGTSDEDEIVREIVAEFSLPLESYSMDAIDIGITKVDGKLYVVAYTPLGIQISEDYVDLNYYMPKAWGVEVDNKEHHVYFGDKEASDVFLTIAYNFPSLNEEAAMYLDQEFKKATEKQANTLDALKWLHRQGIYKLIATTTAIENHLDESLNVLSGRIKTPRLIVVESSMIDDYHMKMNVLSSMNDVYTEDRDLEKTYHLLNGLSLSMTEEHALIDGYGLSAIWSAIPSDSQLLLFDAGDVEEYADELLSNGISQSVIDYLSNSDKIILIQDTPSVIENQNRVAWLEIDDYTYETISVLDNFHHGAMSSNAVLNSALEKAQYTVGAFKGVETSVWAVSAFSLQLSDYDEIIKSAESFAKGVSDNFQANVAGKSIDIVAKDGAKGFMDGYKKGVEMYFKLVKMTK